MILVTGAAGKTGTAVLTALGSMGASVKALVRHRMQIAEVERLGAKTAVAADLLDLEQMSQAMEGVRAVYVIAPNMHPDEARIGEIVIEAARRVGAERIVFHSVLHPQTREMPHHWQKLAVEERLFESGLDFTILQPSAYMQNVLPYWDEIVEKGVYRVPYGDRGALSLVDLDDVAEVAAKVLTSSEFDGGVYELAGPEPLSPSQIAAKLGRALGREVRAQRVPSDAWLETARASGVRGYSLDSLTKMFGYYDRNGLVGNDRVLESLLGRRATNFQSFLFKTLEAREPEP